MTDIQTCSINGIVFHISDYVIDEVLNDPKYNWGILLDDGNGWAKVVLESEIDDIEYYIELPEFSGIIFSDVELRDIADEDLMIDLENIDYL